MRPRHYPAPTVEPSWRALLLRMRPARQGLPPVAVAVLHRLSRQQLLLGQQIPAHGPAAAAPARLFDPGVHGRTTRRVTCIRCGCFCSPARCVLALIGFINQHLEHTPGSRERQASHARAGSHGRVRSKPGDDGKGAAAPTVHPAQDKSADEDEAKPTSVPAANGPQAATVPAPGESLAREDPGGS